jgi:hypothetical protein
MRVPQQRVCDRICKRRVRASLTICSRLARCLFVNRFLAAGFSFWFDNLTQKHAAEFRAPRLFADSSEPSSAWTSDAAREGLTA